MNHIIVADYDGLSVSFTNDGWFNATTAAARFNKNPTDWQRLPATDQYLAALKRRYGEISYVKTSKARADRGGGTWMHPRLAVRYAQWLDVDFAIWCDEQIGDLLRGTHPVHDWKRQRHATASLNKVMNQTVVESRLANGKASAPHHFINEAKVVNFAICGKFEGLDRDRMSLAELDLLARLQVRNTVMLARDLSYTDRKAALVAYANEWRTEHLQLIEA